MRALVLDKASWKKHIMLDKLTGLDPPGVKLRAAQGFGESCSETFPRELPYVLKCRTLVRVIILWNLFHDQGLIGKQIC